MYPFPFFTLTPSWLFNKIQAYFWLAKSNGVILIFKDIVKIMLYFYQESCRGRHTFALPAFWTEIFSLSFVLAIGRRVIRWVNREYKWNKVRKDRLHILSTYSYMMKLMVILCLGLNPYWSGIVPWTTKISLWQGLQRDQKSGGAKLWWDLSQTLQRV